MNEQQVQSSLIPHLTQLGYISQTRIHSASHPWQHQHHTRASTCQSLPRYGVRCPATPRKRIRFLYLLCFYCVVSLYSLPRVKRGTPLLRIFLPDSKGTYRKAAHPTRPNWQPPVDAPPSCRGLGVNRLEGARC